MTRSPRPVPTAVAVAGLVLAGLTALTGPTASGAPAAERPYRLENGRSAPVHSYRDAIRETVWVTAPDYDGDGEADRVAADIIRPRETQAAGVDVPVVMDASP